MAVLSYKLGPGTLTIGTGPLDVSAQVTKCIVEADENVDTVDAIDVLSGEQIAAEDTASYKWKLSATFVQDTLAAAGLVDFTWTNAGVNIPFKFIPATAIARKVTGTIRCVPLAIGGDVKKRNTSDWSPAIIGTPVLAATP
jgi:hypothetical protein